MPSSAVILDGLVSSTPATSCIPQAGVLPRSHRCRFSPLSAHRRRCDRRCHHRSAADVPSLSHGRCTAIAHFAAPLFLSH
jgi:hypothetical protein